MTDKILLPDDFFSNFTLCDTPADSLVYPGKLNTDENGKPYITPNSDIEDFKRSILGQARRMGVTHPYEIALKQTNKNIPSSVVKDLTDLSNLGKVPTQEEIDRFFLYATPGMDKPDFNPSLLELTEQIDKRALLPDLNLMATLGDPRWSDGCAMQNVLQKFYPIIEAYKEVLEVGNVTLDQDCCYCTEEGVKIKEASAYVKHALLDLCGTTTGPLSAITPPTIEQIYNYMDEQREMAYTRHAEAFVIWFKKTYPKPDWTWQLVYNIFPSFFFIKVENKAAIERDILNKKITPLDLPDIDYALKNGVNPKATISGKSEVTFSDIKSKSFVPPDQYNSQHVDVVRYYPDMRTYVSTELGEPIQNVDSFVVSREQAQNAKIMSSLTKPIPDYTKMI